MLIFVVIAYDQCELHIIRSLFSVCLAPGAGTMRRDATEGCREKRLHFYFSHFVSTFPLCKHVAHLHNLLVEWINRQCII